ncbi:hypothetical protein ACFZDG_10990 [Kitasatospora xanthocidica]|uniref:hypothetical protein n=1 Tax=Kitasatospora xanthocidica TaxID=83382 RepID=UPI0036E82489
MGLFNRTKTTAAAPVAAVAVATTAGPDLSHLTGDWTIDATHSEIGFSVRHPKVANILI